MSNKSRRRATKSRHRVTVAAGAILAGAAIPIAAAGTAWADDDTVTVAQAEKDAKAGEPVEISINGKIIKDTCGADCSANSGTVGEHNKAIAIGTGSEATVTDATDSTAKASGGSEAIVENTAETGTVSHDTATANGANSEARVLNLDIGTASANVTHDVATASGGGTALVRNFDGSGVTDDTAKASSDGMTTIDNRGAGAVTDDTATTSNGGIGLIENDRAAGAISHDTVSASGTSASGTNPLGISNSYAQITNESGTSSEPVSNDKATATNGGYANVANDGDSTVAITHDTASGNNGATLVLDAGSSKATAVNTGPAQLTDINGGGDNAVTAGASVSYATASTANAENTGSQAAVSGTTATYITGSSAEDTNGTTTQVTASDTHEVNGMVVPHVEMTPLTDVHEMHMMPPMPLP
jgi:hypothetical protein